MSKAWSLSSYLVYLAIFAAGCSPAQETSTPRRTTSNQTGNTGGGSSPAAQTGPVHLLSIPDGNGFVASCTKTLKVTSSIVSSGGMSDAGSAAASVMSELSKKGGVKICAEYFADTSDSEKASLIEDMGGSSCRLSDVISAAVFSLKEPCPAPQTGSQEISKSSPKIFRRSTLYITGASSDQLKKLSVGLSEAFPVSSSDESKRTDDLR